MQTTFSFHEVHSATRALVRRFVARKLRRLERLLDPAERETARLRVVARAPAPGGGRWELRLVLSVPPVTLTAEATTRRELHSTLDAVEQDLWSQLREFRAQRRRDATLSARRGLERAIDERNDARSDLSASFPALANEFREWILARAARDLGALESSRRLPRHRRSAEGLADETLLVAWERRHETPSTGDVRDWLAALLAEVLAHAVENADRTTPERPTTRAAGDEDDRGDDSIGARWLELCELAARDDDIWEDTLPSRNSVDTLHGTTLAEEEEVILRSLARLTEPDRSAFRLWAFDGYERDEIAMIQGRDVTEVERSLATARDSAAAPPGFAKPKG